MKSPEGCERGAESWNAMGGCWELDTYGLAAAEPSLRSPAASAAAAAARIAAPREGLACCAADRSPVDPGSTASSAPAHRPSKGASSIAAWNACMTSPSVGRRCCCCGGGCWCSSCSSPAASGPCCPSACPEAATTGMMPAATTGGTTNNSSACGGKRGVLDFARELPPFGQAACPVQLLALALSGIALLPLLPHSFSWSAHLHRRAHTCQRAGVSAKA